MYICLKIIYSLGYFLYGFVDKFIVNEKMNCENQNY